MNSSQNATSKKIMVVTTGRADYGLLCPLLDELEKSKFCELLLVATGMHLSKLHGYTISEIIKDGRDIAAQVEMRLDADDPHSLCIAIADGISGFSKIFQEFIPDIVVVLGDRYELWSICMAAVLHRIPIAHIHGGESTQGLIDDYVRHSVTKMSVWHFTSIDIYAKRIVQMGEKSENVHVVGAIGLDNIKRVSVMSIKELSNVVGVDFEIQKIALFTFHPVTQNEYFSSTEQIRTVLDAVLSSTDLVLLATMPNADVGGKGIYEELINYSNKNQSRIKLVKNLGQNNYLNAMKYAHVMIGNSSSGIIEAASFCLPVINIGDRQGGRFKPANVIDCECEGASLSKALKKALSKEFRDNVVNLSNPYGDGFAAPRIVSILENIDVSNRQMILKKGFKDIEITRPWYMEDCN